MQLIEHNGERMLVHSLAGHEGCKVIVKDAEHPEHGYAKLARGKWVEDPDAKAAADEEARLRRMTRAELIAEATAAAKRQLREVSSKDSLPIEKAGGA